MQQTIKKLISESLEIIKKEKKLSFPESFPLLVERTRDPDHGDFASNIAMVLSKATGIKPRDLAAEIIQGLPASDTLDKVEIAGPGFINFFLNNNAFLNIIKEIHRVGEEFGYSDKNNKKILIEFVSANPTGPLHIGHGRGAAYGDSVANLLEAAGYEVSREYYVNDAGRQMDILTISIWLRYLEYCGQTIAYPEKAYQADYIQAIANNLFHEYGNDFEVTFSTLIADDWHTLEHDAQLDTIIAAAKTEFGEIKFNKILNAGLHEILADIQNDLQEFGITYDNWYSERSLFQQGLVEACIEQLTVSGNIYESGGAKWFQSTKYNDEKDRVVERDNSQLTYFASDIAYHKNKFDRGFDKLIDIWGADHHGYISRVKGALSALDKNPDALDILLVQFATLYRGKEKIPMSTRAGNYITLRELRREVGNDAARFFYVMRKSEQHLDFDLELAKSQSNDNPVYYIQYAHARVCSVLQEMEARNYAYNEKIALQQLGCLTEMHELALLKTLSRYPETVVSAAEKYEPHAVGFYLRDLANDFHSYYNTHQFLCDDDNLRQARICLIIAIRQVIRNGLKILGVTAPEKM